MVTEATCSSTCVKDIPRVEGGSVHRGAVFKFYACAKSPGRVPLRGFGYQLYKKIIVTSGSPLLID